jgi:tetratricopeptide (TPR) repeat protein
MGKKPKHYTLADVLWERDVWQAYYEGMEALREQRFVYAEKCFEEIIQLNPEFPGSYEGLAGIAMMQKKREGARTFTDLAFEKVLATYPRWPRYLLWGELENRPILRIIQMKALLYHEDGEHKEAEKLYRLLLKLNPNDNQGIRYLLDGLKKGLRPDEIGN